MKKNTTIYLCLLIFNFLQISVFAQIPEYLKPGETFEFKARSNDIKNDINFIQKLQSVITPRPYDVLKYQITLDWYDIMNSNYTQGSYRQFSGKNRMTFLIDSVNTSKIELDAENLLIDSVFSNEDKYPLNFSQKSSSFVVTLLSPKLPGDTVIIDIFYTYVGKDNAGLYLFSKGDYVGQGPPPKRDSIFVLERLAYTMSEPNDARKWVPCNDNPYDKAYVEMNVRVPKGFNIATNGTNKGAESLGDTVIYHYASDFPMSSYLMAVNCSKFKTVIDKYYKVTNPNEFVPIEYNIWDEDWTSDTTNGGAYNAEYSFRNTPKMVEAFSKVFGEYPFEKYGMVAVQPFGFGGMEHQTMTTINRTWLRGYSETGIAHELAHQWLGDMITCASWLDVWINEGGATWSEALWLESLYGKDIYYQYMNQIISRYKNEETIFDIPIYAVPLASIFNYPISILEYNKASWIYHMLREQIGDEQFFPGFRSFLNKYRFKSLETIDFMKSMKEFFPNSNINFDVFFDQWLVKSGHPIFNINSAVFDWGSGKSKVKITLNQIQEGMKVPATFETPVEFLFFKDSVIIGSKEDYINSNNQTFEYILPFYPDSVAINSNKLLCTIQDNLLSINQTDITSLQNTNITPNPVKRGNEAKFSYCNSINQNVEIFICDYLGNKVQTILNENLPVGNFEIKFETNKLSSGSYFIVFRNNNLMNTIKCTVIE